MGVFCIVLAECGYTANTFYIQVLVPPKLRKTWRKPVVEEVLFFIYLVVHITHC